MEGLIGALGQLGPIGIALVILLVMWLLNRQTTARYVEIIERQRKYIEELDSDHDKDLAELQKSILDLKTEIVELKTEMQKEREARRHAEERAHELSLRLRGPYDG